MPPPRDRNSSNHAPRNSRGTGGKSRDLGLRDANAKCQIVPQRHHQQQPFYGPLSGTTWVSGYQKKHSPTHHSDHHPIFISFFHLPRCPQRMPDFQQHRSTFIKLTRLKNSFFLGMRPSPLPCKVTGYSSSQHASPLLELTCHMGSHSVTCRPAEVTFQLLPQPKLVLDLATPEGCKAELT